ncbi:MAG: hypothetical protein ABIQ30_17680 [Devosia sp.]
MAGSSDMNNIAEMHEALDRLSAEVDRFRIAAFATRSGEKPSSRMVGAADDVHAALMNMLEELDTSFSDLQPGHPDFSILLTAQTKALGLLESVSNSHDVLANFVAEEVAEPITIYRASRIAAE